MRIIVSLLFTAFSAVASHEIAPVNENGQAIVINNCSYPVYFKSVGNFSPLDVSTLVQDAVYQETYQLRALGNDTYGGVSIKLSSNQTIATAVDPSSIFDASTITQFEYTYTPIIWPGLFYDISNVNGYIGPEADAWNGILPWPFQAQGLKLEGTGDCPDISCDGGDPSGNASCSEAYTHSTDDWATRQCRNDNSLTLTLCIEP